MFAWLDVSAVFVHFFLLVNTISDLYELAGNPHPFDQKNRT